MKSITLKKHFIVLAVLLATSLTAWAENTQEDSGYLVNSSNEKICHWQLMSDGELILTAGTLNNTNHGSGDFTNVQLSGTRFSNTNANQAIKKLTISNGIKNLVNFPCNADKANKFENLEEVNAPFADLETIGSKAFWGSTKLKKVTLNTGLKVIGLSAFASCTALETVTITDVNNASAQSALTTIDVEAFSGCTKLQGFSLNCSGAVSIGSMAFKDCTSLKNFYKGGGAVTVDASAFSGSGLETFCNSSSALYVTNLTLQNGAFAGASKLKGIMISIGSSDITIPYHAFQNCTSLEDFTTWGGGEVTVGNGAFEGCTSLESIYCTSSYNNITSVGSKAFSGCTSLESFTAAAALTSIGTSAFENCTGMKYVDLRNANAEALRFEGKDESNIHTLNRTDSWCHTMSKGAFIYYANGGSGDNIVQKSTNTDKWYCSQCKFYENTPVGFPSEIKFTAQVYNYRTLAANRYYTICLPYIMKNANWKYYTLDGVTGSTIKFKEVSMNDVVANQPYVIYTGSNGGTGSDDYFYTSSSNVEVGGTADYISKDDYGLWGNFGKTIDAAYLANNYPSSNIYILQSDGKWKLFDGSNDDVKIPPFRAYILVDKNAGAPAMLASDFGGSTTGIGDLTPSLSEGEGVWYDLQGRRIEGRPTQKGVYIVGGKKIIVK